MKQIIKSIILASCMTCLLGCEGKETVFEMTDASRDTYVDATLHEEQKETEDLILVHVCGAVHEPGVISLQVGSRVIDAVTLAGGMTADADLDYLNLAAVLKDGEKIYVPTRQEVLLWEEEKAQTELVNINTANETQLCTLPGIGESKAKDIIAYREANGEFQSIEEIMKVPGIKESLFQKVKDLIKVK